MSKKRLGGKVEGDITDVTHVMIAKALGISPQAVSQIEAKAIRRLWLPSYRPWLEARYGHVEVNNGYLKKR